MIRVIALVNILLTLGLIIIGGLVSANMTGLECTSWPICYVKDTVNNQSIYPALHRIFAGIIIVLNSFLFFKNRENRPIKVGLLLLIIQSILGAITFFYKLPTITSTFHLFLSLAYILVFAQFFTPVIESVKEKISNYNPSIKDFVFVLMLVIFMQFFFGGIIHQTATKDICGVGEQVNLMCLEQGTTLALWPKTVAARIHSLHKYLGIGSLTLLFIYLVLVKNFLFSLRGKNFTQLLTATISLSVLFLLHLVNSKRLFNLGETTYFQVLHLLLAVLIAICTTYIYSWFGKYEDVNLGGKQHTVASDMLSLTKPRLGLLVVSTIVSGILLTGEYVDFFYLINALLFSILIVMSATTINCYMEIDVDSNMERTKDRALPAGRLSPKTALVQGWLLFIVGFTLTWVYVNEVTAILGAVAFFSYLYIYTPMKRTSPAALFVGALPGAIPPVMGRTIVTGEIDGLAILLFAILFIWQIPHFMAISIYHKDDYADGDIKVYPHFYSVPKMKWNIVLYTLLLFVVSCSGFFFGLNSRNFFYASLVVNSLFFVQSLQSYFVGNSEKYISWARQYFWGSIIYLPLLLSLMIFLS